MTIRRLFSSYRSFDAARGSVERLNVTAEQIAFTAAGRVIEVSPVENLWANMALTDRHDLPRLRALLHQAHGPAHLGDDPIPYAHKWWRLDKISSTLPPFLPTAIHNWAQSDSRSPGIWSCPPEVAESTPSPNTPS